MDLLSSPAAETDENQQMTRYALLLRGVNVGTKNSLPMAELRGMLEEIGCTGVRTYVQSGNAVFATRLRAPDAAQGQEASGTR